MFGLDRRQSVMLTVLLAGAFLVVLNATMISPALPAIMAQMGVPATTAQWLASGYALIEAAIIPLNAFLIGRFSTRKLFIGGMGLFSVGALVAGTSPVFPVLLAGRLLQAAGTGIVMPMVMTLIVTMIPRERRGSAMGMMGLIISFAPAIGPSLSGVLVDTAGWHSLFLVSAALGACLVAASFFVLENRDGFERSDLDLPSVPLLLAGILSLLYGVATSTSAQNKVEPIALIVLGAALLAFFAWRQTRLEHPLLRVQVLRTRRFRTAVLLMALLQATLIGSEIALPLFVQQVLGQSATVSGLLMLPGAVLGALSGFFAGGLFDRIGIRKPVLVGAAGLAIGAAGVLSFSMTIPIWQVAAVYTLIFIGIQFLVTPLNTWGINALSPAEIPHGNALSATTGQIGSSMGTAFMSSLVALGSVFAVQGATAAETTFAGVHIAFTGMAVMLLLIVGGIVSFVRLTDAEKRVEDEARAVAAVAPAGVAGVDRGWVVADIMNAKPQTVREGATVGDAIQAMRVAETVGVPVVDGEGRPVGYISDGDVLRYLARMGGSYSDGMSLYRIMDNEGFSARLKALLALDVSRLASTRILSVDADVDIEEGYRRLASKRVKKLIVTHNGRLVGTFSRRNVLNSLRVVERAMQSGASDPEARERIEAEIMRADELVAREREESQAKEG